LAGVTYKCPSCGAYLTFDPESQQWQCPFCDSTFQQTDLTEKDEQSAEVRSEGFGGEAYEGAQVVYHCPSCGSEIMTDETTVATHCYYCHSPVVLQGKLTDDMRPDSVLPFTIDREKAASSFMNWVKSKRYVPKGFFSRDQIQNLTGVYYPHFVTRCEAEGVLQGTASNVSVMNTPDYIITKTDHYSVRREADITFDNIMRPALTKANRKLSDGIHPFPLDGAKPFSDAYLSGFVAERRDIDADSIREDIQQEIGGYVKPLLSDTVRYDNQNLQASARLTKMDSRYVLLPTWVLTYPNKHSKNDPYYYAMNGCTGEVCGKLPIDKKKLYLTGLAIGAAIFAAGCLISYFLF